MNLHPETLRNNPRYQLLYELDHEQLVKFVQSNLRKSNPVTIFYIVINLLIFLFTGYKIFTDIAIHAVSWDFILTRLGMGFFATFIIGFFIHENLHLLAYKILGAKQATVKVQWRKLVFLALADQFVLNRKEFYFLAILPFLVITCLLLAGMAFADNNLYYVLLGILLFHTGGCSGDFALISFFYSNRRKNILTYDDVPSGRSFFWEELEDFGVALGG